MSKASTVQPPPAIAWFRSDLRLADNPALSAAIAHGPLVPLFIWAPDEEIPWSPGAASRWWLHQSLANLDRSLKELGGNLILRKGSTLSVLLEVLQQTGARSVFWNRRYEPAVTKRDEELAKSLQKAGVEVHTFKAGLLFEPSEIRNQAGKPFQVFTPFWRHCLSLASPTALLSAPRQVLFARTAPRTVSLPELKLEPVPDWASGLRAAWVPGENSAHAQFSRFISSSLDDYTENRNRPDLPGTSRLSPHLHFGEISPRQVWHGLASLNDNIQESGRSLNRGPDSWKSSQYLTELGWREFAHHLLFHFPHTTTEPLRPEFAKFRWRKEPAWLKAWQRGQTGYPIVDAGMRELWHTGWMHNRVRMIVASFLVKDLLLPWQEGARWFWDTLVDADLAQNTLGWQWSAGCGADAAPFFRIFNPIMQGKKFDPLGAYIRRWVPELASVPVARIHAPFENKAQTVAESNGNYPPPIVSHALARELALDAYHHLRRD